MLAKNEVTKIYETILSIPGMNDPVKIAISMPRKAVLLLSKVIERGLKLKDPDDKSASVLDMVSNEELKALADIAADILEKAGLSEMNKKLQTL